ncbi:MAG TPA: DUF2789 domain-containing protein [Dongiaceae bacterium]|nr:DUF2789 domain-containing protein [Dongiaceae bacterium]
MEIATPTFSDLFMQLGLESDEKSIRRFCATHKITGHITLPDAEFWTPQQAHFLRESWHQDSDWAILIDQLNSSLRH